MTLVVICILHISLGMNDVIITSQGKHWPWSISETLSIIGRKQCTEECQARGSACLAVNYLRTHLQCEILKKTPNNLTELADDINYEYIEMESQTSVWFMSYPRLLQNLYNLINDTLNYLKKNKFKFTSFFALRRNTVEIL